MKNWKWIQDPVGRLRLGNLVSKLLEKNFNIHYHSYSHVSFPVGAKFWQRFFWREGPGGGGGPCTAKNQCRKMETNIPEKELRGHSSNFHIHVSVSDLHIPTIDLPILPQEICRIYKTLADTWMWKLGLRPRNSQKKIHKWLFRCIEERRLEEADRFLLSSYLAPSRIRATMASSLSSLLVFLIST